MHIVLNPLLCMRETSTNRHVVLILTEAYVCFGYDASVIGGLLAMPAFIRTFGTTGADGQRILTASQVSVITATRTSCSVPAVFVCSYFGNKIGRKKTILLGSAICLCGTAIQTGSINEAMITVGLWVASKLEIMAKNSEALIC